MFFPISQTQILDNVRSLNLPKTRQENFSLVDLTVPRENKENNLLPFLSTYKMNIKRNLSLTLFSRYFLLTWVKELFDSQFQSRNTFALNDRSMWTVDSFFLYCSVTGWQYVPQNSLWKVLLVLLFSFTLLKFVYWDNLISKTAFLV